jgi:hypothetical protein
MKKHVMKMFILHVFEINQRECATQPQKKTHHWAK